MTNNYRFNAYPVSDKEKVIWKIVYPELEGIIGYGESIEEALENGQLKLETYLENARKQNKSVKLPKVYLKRQCSGKLLLRIPVTLHEELFEVADSKQISLNNLIIQLLSIGLSVYHQ